MTAASTTPATTLPATVVPAAAWHPNTQVVSLTDLPEAMVASPAADRDADGVHAAQLFLPFPFFPLLVLSVNKDYILLQNHFG